MHFEILVEDISGKKALDIILPRILNSLKGDHTHKGIIRLVQEAGD